MADQAPAWIRQVIDSIGLEALAAIPSPPRACPDQGIDGWPCKRRADVVLGSGCAPPAHAPGLRPMTPHESSRVRGKLFFLMSAAFAAVGRAATLPLVQRQYRDKDYAFEPGSELHHSLLFFRALLPRLPDLEMAVAPDARRPLLVYTDAAFWLAKTRSRADECATGRARLRGGMGAVVLDPEDNSVRVAHGLPDWRVLLASWRHDRKTYIAELETLAAIAVYSTYPSVFRGRKVNHFIDNTVALCCTSDRAAGRGACLVRVLRFGVSGWGLSRVSVELACVRACPMAHHSVHHLHSC
jgi:hypothetical protein